MGEVQLVSQQGIYREVGNPAGRDGVELVYVV
jgi:hypothetical protein